jgi:hypothetical protein
MAEHPVASQEERNVTAPRSEHFHENVKGGRFQDEGDLPIRSLFFFLLFPTSLTTTESSWPYSFIIEAAYQLLLVAKKSQPNGISREVPSASTKRGNDERAPLPRPKRPEIREDPNTASEGRPGQNQASLGGHMRNWYENNNMKML